MFDLEGMRRTWTNSIRFIFGSAVFGENPSEFKVALSGFGVNGDSDGWIGFLGNAKQIFEPMVNPWVHWAPYEQTYLRRTLNVLETPKVSLPVCGKIFWILLTVTRESVVLPLPSLSRQFYRMLKENDPDRFIEDAEFALIYAKLPASCNRLSFSSTLPLPFG